jgi:hypothetical protein
MIKFYEDNCCKNSTNYPFDIKIIKIIKSILKRNKPKYNTITLLTYFADQCKDVLTIHSYIPEYLPADNPMLDKWLRVS